MSLQQLEAFLDRAQTDPALQAPLAVAPDVEAVAAIATAAGFAVTAEDLLAAAGEPPEVVAMIEVLEEIPVQPAQSELEAFLQQVEVDADLQRVLAAAPDAEGVAAVARIAGFQVSAEELWEASDETPAALESPAASAPMAEQEPAAATEAPASGASDPWRATEGAA